MCTFLKFCPSFLTFVLLSSCASFNTAPKKSVTLAWNAAQSRAKIEGYRIYNGTKPGVFDGSCLKNNYYSNKDYIEIKLSKLSDVNNPKYTVSGLKNEQCVFSISAFNEFGESNKSEAVLIKK